MEGQQMVTARERLEDELRIVNKRMDELSGIQEVRDIDTRRDIARAADLIQHARLLLEDTLRRHRELKAR